MLHGKDGCLVVLTYSGLKKSFGSILTQNDIFACPIDTYLLSGPQVIRKEIQQQKSKDLETPPEGPHTAFRERLRPLSRP